MYDRTPLGDPEYELLDDVRKQSNKDTIVDKDNKKKKRRNRNPRQVLSQHNQKLIQSQSNKQILQADYKFIFLETADKKFKLLGLLE